MYAGDHTEKNLESTYASKLMTRNKYTYYASKAKIVGFEQIVDLFLENSG